VTIDRTTHGARAPHRWSALGTVYVPPPPPAKYRSFGLTVGGVLAAIAAFSWWRGHPIRAETTGVIAAALIVTALVAPAALAGVAAAWSRLGHALGWFNSRVLLTVLFFLILWPIGAISRLFGNDPLERRRRGSRWSPYPERLRDPKHFERLF
jgi:hypothetical protein